MELNYQLISQLSELGVRKITLSPDAAEQLFKRIKGLYVPGNYQPEADQFDMGMMAGIELYREPHGR